MKKYSQVLDTTVILDVSIILHMSAACCICTIYYNHPRMCTADMRLWSGPSRRTGRDEAHDSRSGYPVLQGAGNIDGRQALHRGHRRVERRLYIRRASHPADTVPRPRHGSTSKPRPESRPSSTARLGVKGGPVSRCRNTIYIVHASSCCVHGARIYYIYLPHRISGCFYYF
jgi:hypothetical protein